MNILSLFDGMSCGQIAAERAGLSVDTYYAAEIDKHAISVTMDNYPDTVQLGDVTKWREWDIDWSSIDLLIGGSPCQGFSFAGKQLAFDDPRSALFFVYVDILNHIRGHNPNVKFLLENVNRQRFYWASWDFMPPKDRGVYMTDYDGKITTDRNLNHPVVIKHDYSGTLDLIGYYGKNSNSQRVYGKSGKLPALLTNNTGGNNPLWISEDGGKSAKQAHVNLCEFLQTVPMDYTSSASQNQRYRMLGNGWTVDVITHIFRALNA